MDISYVQHLQELYQPLCQGNNFERRRNDLTSIGSIHLPLQQDPAGFLFQYVILPSHWLLSDEHYLMRLSKIDYHQRDLHIHRQ